MPLMTLLLMMSWYRVQADDTMVQRMMSQASTLLTYILLILSHKINLYWANCTGPGLYPASSENLGMTNVGTHILHCFASQGYLVKQ